MLSICIPHFNFQNPELFQALHQQASLLNVHFEIIIIDDQSTIDHKIYLRDFNYPPFKVIFLERNIGRSAIRNLLAAKAQYEWILFLDGDSRIDDEQFLSKYFKYLNYDIISGGRKYPETAPLKPYQLHWSYGIKTESLAKSSFHSNNFMIRRSIFDQLQFDENIREYGYEDVVFGLEAAQLNYQMISINNPVVHQQLKNNNEFIADVEQAIINLLKIQQLRNDLPLAQSIKLILHYQKLKKWRLNVLLTVLNVKIIQFLKSTLLKEKSFKNKDHIRLKLLKLYLYHHYLKADTVLPPSLARQHPIVSEW